MQTHANIFCAVLSVFLSELKRITHHCQTPFPPNRFRRRFHSSGMCHAFKYLTDFNELKLLQQLALRTTYASVFLSLVLNILHQCSLHSVFSFAKNDQKYCCSFCYQQSQDIS